MKVGLYFGSFNPIHIGHLIIAQHIAIAENLSQVWFIVSPHNPLKKSNTLLNEYHRLHLVNLSIENNPLLKASDVEFKLPRPSYTIDTLTYLQEKFPQHEFSIIIGSDSLNNLPRWKNFQQIVSGFPILVYPRPNHAPQKKWPQNIKMVDAPILDISSTHIRALISAKKSIRYLVTDTVKEEIERNSYYT